MLAGPAECPQRPFCQPGLETTYSIQFGPFLPGRRRWPGHQDGDPDRPGHHRPGVLVRQFAHDAVITASRSTGRALGSSPAHGPFALVRPLEIDRRLVVGGERGRISVTSTPMPAPTVSTAPDRADLRSRLLGAQFWVGIGLAPIAVLLLLLGGTAAAAVLAIIAVVVLALSVMLRSDLSFDAGVRREVPTR